ncbi:MAG: DNA repair protein RecO [Oscillospiraceae bacterium]|nr:DNA repair protein RecO [Oscillospiraceae bacterium]
MFETIKGLVLRQAKYKEADLILTLLTAEHGKMTVKARGALRKGSRLGAASQILCYSEFTLFGNRGRWSANEGVTIDQFLGLREDIAQLALGAYFAQLLDTVCQEEIPAGPVLSLALNSLYALSRGMYGPEHVKAVLELRLMCLEGFQPEVSACGVCGRVDMDEPVFSPQAGMAHCRACGSAVSGGAVPLDEAALAAMRHIVGAEARKEFSFAIPEESEKRLCRACEQLVRCQLDREFNALDYWKSVR